jgi:hypothetical protein
LEKKEEESGVEDRGKIGGVEGQAEEHRTESQREQGEEEGGVEAVWPVGDVLREQEDGGETQAEPEEPARECETGEPGHVVAGAVKEGGAYADGERLQVEVGGCADDEVVVRQGVWRVEAAGD